MKKENCCHSSFTLTHGRPARERPKHTSKLVQKSKSWSAHLGAQLSSYVRKPQNLDVLERWSLKTHVPSRLGATIRCCCQLSSWKQCSSKVCYSTLKVFVVLLEATEQRGRTGRNETQAYLKAHFSVKHHIMCFFCPDQLGQMKQSAHLIQSQIIPKVFDI